MNAAYLEKPLADIVLSHDIVVRKTYISIHRIPFLQ